MVVRKGKVVMQKRTNKAGEIITDGAERDLRSVFGHAMPDGVQYEIEFEDGVTAIYRPWKGNKSLYASAGELEVRVDGACSPDLIEKALEKIERLGLNASPATIEDAEIMYLQKQAEVVPLHAASGPFLCFKKPAWQQSGKNGDDPQDGIKYPRGQPYGENNFGCQEVGFLAKNNRTSFTTMRYILLFNIPVIRNIIPVTVFYSIMGLKLNRCPMRHTREIHPHSVMLTAFHWLT